MGEKASSRLWTQCSEWRADIGLWDIDLKCIMIPYEKHVSTIMVASGMVLFLVLRCWAVSLSFSSIYIILWTVILVGLNVAKNWYAENRS